MDPATLTYYQTHATTVAARYESIVNGLAQHFECAFPPGARVLDLGCGSGRDMALLMQRGCDVYGLDATAELLEQAKKFHPELEGRLALGVLPDSPVPFGGEFDGILCSAVLMHIPVALLARAVQFVSQCLKLGGTFLYSVPSRRGDVVGDEHRDASGRLFLPDISTTLQTLCMQKGFCLVDQWGNEDSLGRGDVAWVSVLMRRTAA